MTLERMQRIVLGIMGLSGCGGAHEIERDDELSEFAWEVERQDDGSIFVCDEHGDRFLITIQPWDSAVNLAPSPVRSGGGDDDGQAKEEWLLSAQHL